MDASAVGAVASNRPHLMRHLRVAYGVRHLPLPTLRTASRSSAGWPHCLGGLLDIWPRTLVILPKTLVATCSALLQVFKYIPLNSNN